MTTEILAKGGGRREGERITEAIGRVLRSASDETLENALNLGDIFKKYNLTPDDFANMFMADVSHAARTLQQAGAVRKAIDASYDDLFGLSAQRKGDLYKQRRH